MKLLMGDIFKARTHKHICTLNYSLNYSFTNYTKTVPTKLMVVFITALSMELLTEYSYIDFDFDFD